MSRRKGELTPSGIDRGWPHQVALPARLSLGKLGEEQYAFCEKLMRCSRGHSVRHNEEDFNVHCFATREGAEAFMNRFGGEWFDPRDRGKGANWWQWHKGRSANA